MSKESFDWRATRMKRQIRNIIRRFGYDIIRFSPTQLGEDPLIDMATFLDSDHPTIFDVGANVGQSIERFRFQFPRCIVHSFEPSPTTFKALSQQASKLNDVHLWNFAFGPVSGQMTFLENSVSVMSSFLPLSESGWGEVIRKTIVDVKTIDQFCHEQNIERIDILKSDTQGFDLEVFRGAEQAMRESKVALVYCEIIFSDQYRNLPTLGEIYEFLTSRDFFLVSFYHFYYQEKLASWTDALFVHKSQLTMLNNSTEKPSHRR